MKSKPSLPIVGAVVGLSIGQVQASPSTWQQTSAPSEVWLMKPPIDCAWSRSWIAPDGPVSVEPFGVMREALRRAKRIGIGQVVLSGKEKPVAGPACRPKSLAETASGGA